MTFTVSAPSAEHLRSPVSGLDAMLTGRRTFDKAHGWDGNHAWGPAFVLTHEIPDGWPRPNSTVHFVTDGVESAVRQAKAAAALLLGRVTYEMMEAGWRPVAQTGVRPEWMPEWMEPFARTIDATKKYVVSSTLTASIGTRSSCTGIWGKSCSSSRRSLASVRVENVEDPLMRTIRYLDKLIDELARGMAMGKILRQ
jgi:dihydrofolate reductase